jgi:hypothetical protein
MDEAEDLLRALQEGIAWGVFFLAEAWWRSHDRVGVKGGDHDSPEEWR